MDNFYIGLILALLSTFLIGISFVFKKKGLIKLSGKGLRACNGGYGYLKECMWWSGMILLAAGEILNFAAYSFAPASLVTPLGAISVIITAIGSSYLLKEKLNIIGKFGCILCITGSAIIIIHVPQEEPIKNFVELQTKLLQPEFAIYCTFIAMLVGYLIFIGIPKWGQTTPLVYVLITGSVGSITVICCKALGVAVHDLYSAKNVFTHTFFWVLLITILICVTCQLTFLNRGLDMFNISVVTPILYVVFTSFVLVASSIVFSELAHQNLSDQMGLAAGLITVVIGIFLINAFQHVVLNIGLSDLLLGGSMPSLNNVQPAHEDLSV